MIKYLLLLIQSMGCMVFSYAQSDTIIDIQPVSVVSSQILHFDEGRDVLTFDSIQLVNAQGQNLGKFLAKETGIYIKSSSPGNLSTVSIRGTGFSHVATLWNGFPIQSPMNGGLDFALINVGSYDEISVLKGGNSAIYGSGAIGGTVILENNSKIKDGIDGNIYTFGNSMKNFGLFTSMDISKREKWNVGFSRSIIYNKNEYQFDKGTIQKNALHEFDAWSGQLLFNLPKKQFLKFWMYYDETDRDISPSKVASYNGEHMKTSSLRLAGEWSKVKQKTKFTFRIGHFRDSLRFQSKAILSLNSTNQTIGQLLVKHYLTNGLKIEYGVYDAYVTANGNNIKNKYQNQLAFFSNWAYKYKSWSTTFSVRAALFDENWSPFTFTWGQKIKVSRLFSIKGNISKNYRSPTLNDLYWPNLGNPNLKSEKGWSGEVSLNYLNDHLQYGLGYFRIEGLDWIIWSPNDLGLWMPNNNQKVVSQGVESNVKYQQTLDEWTFIFSNQLAYTSSVLKEDYYFTTSNDIGKQLIYVPKWKFVGQFGVNYKAIHLNYNHSYTSSVRTIQRQLDGYSVGNLTIRYSPKYFKKRYTMSFVVDNIWNKDYEVVSYYPMPLRNYEIRLGFRF